MLVKVYEIHNGQIDKCDFEKGSNYSYEYATIVDSAEPHFCAISNKASIMLTIDISNDAKLEFIKSISSDFSGAFIILAPTEQQDIIVDFTLDVDMYYNIIDNSKDI